MSENASHIIPQAENYIDEKHNKTGIPHTL
jgi:hypothetical protein